MGKMVDLTGRTINRWFVVERIVGVRGGKVMWLCQCQCGTRKLVRGSHLKAGISKGCHRCRAKLHGHSRRGKRTKTYVCWKAMINRCSCEASIGWKHYGGRGIRVCDRWQGSFQNFLEDMGEMPPGLSIDRIDTNGGYNKDNCRWATKIEQANNCRSNVLLTYRNRTLSVAQWSRRLGVNSDSLRTRLRLGWSVERTLNVPVKSRGKAKTEVADA